MNFKNTQELFESFPNTVLLVGNGNIENKGELIDSYECVVRFNRFKIEGYEEHVGTKINAIGLAAANLERKHTKNLLPVYEKYIDIVPIFTFGNGTKKYNGRMLLLEMDTRLFAAGNLIRNNPKTSLSTGVCAALNLSLFFNKEVHLIGFDFMKSGHYWKQHHIHSPQHKGDLERNIIDKIDSIKLL